MPEKGTRMHSMWNFYRSKLFKQNEISFLLFTIVNTTQIRILQNVTLVLCSY